MEDLIQEKVTQKENELNATYDEKMRNYEERYDTTVSVLGRHDLHMVGLQRARLAAPACSDQEPAPRSSHVT